MMGEEDEGRVIAYVPMFCGCLPDVAVEVELDDWDYLEVPDGKEVHFMGGHGNYYLASRNGKRTYTEMPGGIVFVDEGLGKLCGVSG